MLLVGEQGVVIEDDGDFICSSALYVDDDEVSRKLQA